MMNLHHVSPPYWHLINYQSPTFLPSSSSGKEKREKMRMKATILEVLRWAYRDELVKSGGIGLRESWGAVLAYGEAGVVNFTMRGPVAAGVPHADAFAVDRALQSLPVYWPVDPRGQAAADVRVAVAATCSVCLGPMSGMVESAAAEAALARAYDIRADLVSAALGVVRPPGPEEWLCEPRLDQAGRPVVHYEGRRRVRLRVSGLTRQMVAWDSCWCPVVWAPDPLGVLRERVRWAMIVEALEDLRRILQSGLERWDLDGLGAAAMPWRADARGVAARRVLSDLSPVRANYPVPRKARRRDRQAVLTRA